MAETQALELYRTMLRIRLFEERVFGLASAKRIYGPVHLYIGQEAVAAGVCANLRVGDYVASTHRGHGHLIAKGGRYDRMMAELFAKQTGYCKGKGGSMHIADMSLGILGANGIVGAGSPLAAGSAFASMFLRNDRVSVAFFGDGAANQGTFLEAINIAARYRLPALFVCENNGYGVDTRWSEVSGHPDVADRAHGLGLPGVTVDGQDVEAVCSAAKEAVERARCGAGPTLIECKTYRYMGHCGVWGDPRDPDEVAAWKERDPLAILATRLAGRGIADAADLDSMRDPILEELDAAVSFAEGSPSAPAKDVLADVYKQAEPGAGASRGGTATVHAGEDVAAQYWEEDAATDGTTYAEAEREAVRQEMERDATVVYMGECVAGRFGERSFEMPISESGFTGVGVGAALAGLRPIVEIMFGDFVTVAMDPIVNQAAKIRYMFGGSSSVPLVVRCAFGACAGMGAQHTQTLESWFAGVPGLKVVAPSCVRDVVGLMRSAIRDDNPVVFCYQRNLAGQTGLMPSADHSVPIGEADVKRPGNDATVVTYGAMVPKVLAAAEQLAGTGIDAEVVDLRTLLPLDEETILRSVAKTGRLVVAAEAHGPCSVAAEVAAVVMEKGFDLLRAPLGRVHLGFAPIPFAREPFNTLMPQVDDIVRSVSRTLDSVSETAPGRCTAPASPSSA